MVFDYSNLIKLNFKRMPEFTVIQKKVGEGNCEGEEKQKRKGESGGWESSSLERNAS